MAYTKTTWATDDIITASGLNNIEDGVSSVANVTTGSASIYNNRLDSTKFNVMVRKIGNLVTIRAEIYNASGNTIVAWGNCMLIAEGFRPQELTYFTGIHGTSPCPFVITTGGGLQPLVEISDTQRMAFTISYVVA